MLPSNVFFYKTKPSSASPSHRLVIANRPEKGL